MPKLAAVGLACMFLLSSCGGDGKLPPPRQDVPPQQRAVQLAHNTIQMHSLYGVPGFADRDKILDVFLGLLDDAPQVQELVDRKSFMARQDVFQKAASGEDVSELQDLVERAKGDEALRWKVFSAWIFALVHANDHAGAYFAPGNEKLVDHILRASVHGFGFEIEMRDGNLYIKNVASDGPAASKLEKGWKMISLDSSNSSWFEGLEDAQKMLDESDSLRIVVEDDEGNRREEELEKLLWIPEAMRPSLSTRDGHAVVKMPYFYGQAKDREGVAHDLANVLPAKGQPWILDLRGNPGGALEQALEVARIMGVKGDAWSIRNRHGKVSIKVPPAETDLHSLPSAVWVDGNSASAAEALAGMLQDLGVPVVGQETYGKAAMQLMLPLDPRRFAKDEKSPHGFLMVSSALIHWRTGQAGPLKPDCAVDPIKDASKRYLAYTMATKACKGQGNDANNP